MNKIYDRRAFIKQQLFFGSILMGGGVVLNACNTNESAQKNEENTGDVNPCEDMSGLNESDKKTRIQAAYVEKSPIKDRLCDNCKLYIPAAAGVECGKCLLFKGPVYPSGYCSYWAPRT